MSEIAELDKAEIERENGRRNDQPHDDPGKAGSGKGRENETFATVTGPFVNFIFPPFPGTSFPWIVMWLVIAASFFTIYFGFIQFSAFRHSI